MPGTILVTGGAGYIGSHVVRRLGERGERLVILDDLSTGNRDAVLHGDLVVGSAGDFHLVQSLIRDYAVEAVLHFAASTVVPESVEQPLAYYRNNTLATHALLEACADSGINIFIFSSTAAVYGLPEEVPVAEDAPTRPINPYGSSKLASEWMIQDLAEASDLRHITLRYFNVAGCEPEGRIGQSTPDAHLLIKVASEVALGKRDHLAIYGTDYPTRDGTGVRDYIHVEDLADAHLRALDHLRVGGASAVLNVGYGHGATVREVLDTVQRVHGRTLPIQEAGRRAGDPATLIAQADKIQRVLGWQPHYDDLELIVRTALDWESRMSGKGGGND
ncbi:UDP-glucose 4-epimerase GalE [Thiohalorhabdus sp.]|uniref:UDP-glucose 4-epimerase GalE n=1 Tax=Thiohalorhabdus sp. TaxID=3094134 RepID=UPI002FC2D06E